MTQDRRFSFGLVGSDKDESVEIEFADGKHVLEAHIVKKLGGRRQVEQKADELRALTYAQFLGALERENMRQHLNTFGKQFARGTKR